MASKSKDRKSFSRIFGVFNKKSDQPQTKNITKGYSNSAVSAGFDQQKKEEEESDLPKIIFKGQDIIRNLYDIDDKINKNSDNIDGYHQYDTHKIATPKVNPSIIDEPKNNEINKYSEDLVVLSNEYNESGAKYKAQNMVFNNEINLFAVDIKEGPNESIKILNSYENLNKDDGIRDKIEINFEKYNDSSSKLNITNEEYDFHGSDKKLSSGKVYSDLTITNDKSVNKMSIDESDSPQTSIKTGRISKQNFEELSQTSAKSIIKNYFDNPKSNTKSESLSIDNDSTKKQTLHQDLITNESSSLVHGNIQNFIQVNHFDSKNTPPNISKLRKRTTEIHDADSYRNRGDFRVRTSEYWSSSLINNFFRTESEDSIPLTSNNHNQADQIQIKPHDDVSILKFDEGSSLPVANAYEKKLTNIKNEDNVLDSHDISKESYFEIAIIPDEKVELTLSNNDVINDSGCIIAFSPSSSPEKVEGSNPDKSEIMKPSILNNWITTPKKDENNEISPSGNHQSSEANKSNDMSYNPSFHDLLPYGKKTEEDQIQKSIPIQYESIDPNAVSATEILLNNATCMVSFSKDEISEKEKEKEKVKERKSDISHLIEKEKIKEPIKMADLPVEMVKKEDALVSNFKEDSTEGDIRKKSESKTNISQFSLLDKISNDQNKALTNNLVATQKVSQITFIFDHFQKIEDIDSPKSLKEKKQEKYDLIENQSLKASNTTNNNIEKVVDKRNSIIRQNSKYKNDASKKTELNLQKSSMILSNSSFKGSFIDESRYKIDLDKEDSDDEDKQYHQDDFEDPLDILEREHKEVLHVVPGILDLVKVFPVTQNPRLSQYKDNATDIKELKGILSFLNGKEAIDNLGVINESKGEFSNDTPRVVALYRDKYIIIGTGNGIIHIFNEAEILLETLSTKELKGVSISALGISNDFRVIVAGYENGGIVIFNTHTKAIMKTILNLHKRMITSLVIYGNDPLHILSADNSGLLYTTEIKPKLLPSTKYSRTSQLIIKKGNTITKIIKMNLCMVNVYAASLSDNEILDTIFAISSTTNIMVIAIKPTPSIIYTFDKPSNAAIRDIQLIPSIAWTLAEYSSNSTKLHAFLTIAWGNIIYMIQFIYKGKEMKFTYVGNLVFETNILHINSLATNILIVIDVNYTIYILHCNQFKKQRDNDMNVMNKFNPEEAIIINDFQKYGIVPLMYIKKKGFNDGLPYYDHTIYGSIESNMIILLTKNNILKVKLKDGIECLNDIYKEGDLIKYLHIGLDIITNKTPLLIGIPNHHQKRLDLFVPIITSFIIKYIQSGNFLENSKNQFEFSEQETLKIDSDRIKDSHIINRLDSISDVNKENVLNEENNNNKGNLIINSIIDFECEIENYNVLFKDIKIALDNKNYTGVFLCSLEPFIIRNRIKRMPDQTLREIANYYCNPRIFKEPKYNLLQQLLLKLDLSQSDYLSIINICLESNLDSALFYISSKFDNNFTLPLIKLFNDIKVILDTTQNKPNYRDSICSNSLAQYNKASLSTSVSSALNESNEGCDGSINPAAMKLVHKVLWYIKSCLKRSSSFFDKQISNTLWIHIVSQIKIIFFEEANLKILMKIEPYITISLILLILIDESSSLIENDHLKVYNILIKILYDPVNFAIQKKIEIFLTANLLQVNNIQFLDENTVYKVLESYWTNPLLIDDKLFIEYHKIMCLIKDENDDYTDVISMLKTKINNRFIKQERDKISEIFIQNCKQILDKKKVLHLLELLAKTKMSKKSQIKNELMLMRYVVDNNDNIDIIDEDLLIIYVEILSMIRQKKERKKILPLLLRFNAYPINKMIEICSEYNIKDAWAYLESKNGNFAKALELNYEIFCFKVKKYFAKNKIVDWKKTQEKFTIKLHNIIENLKLITYDYKEYWFDYLNRLHVALSKKKRFENNATELKEFMKIHDFVIDEIINGIISLFTVKEILNHIMDDILHPDTLQRLLTKLIYHYSYEMKAYSGYNELSIHDYADLILRISRLNGSGLLIYPICEECGYTIVDVDKAKILYCGHIFHATNCLEQFYCPVCQKSESNILTSILSAINLRWNKANQKSKTVNSSSTPIPKSNIKSENKTKLLNQEKRENKHKKLRLLDDIDKITNTNRIFGWSAFE